MEEEPPSKVWIIKMNETVETMQHSKAIVKGTYCTYNPAYSMYCMLAYYVVSM